MLIGVLFYQQSYTIYKYMSVLCMCGGISIYAVYKGYNAENAIASAGASITNMSDPNDAVKQVLGLLLVFGNLGLDGYTNNEQDKIFKQGATALDLMKSVNLWQAIYLALYLLGGYLFSGCSSEASRALEAVMLSSEIRADIFWFCVCAGCGQVLIFSVMKQYGSLVWITVSITRKLMTILLSVIVFNHAINGYQWMGVMMASVGMILEVVGKYKEAPKEKVDDKKKKKVGENEFCDVDGANCSSCWGMLNCLNF